MKQDEKAGEVIDERVRMKSTSLEKSAESKSASQEQSAFGIRQSGIGIWESVKSQWTADDDEVNVQIHEEGYMKSAKSSQRVSRQIEKCTIPCTPPQDICKLKVKSWKTSWKSTNP